MSNILFNMVFYIQSIFASFSGCTLVLTCISPVDERGKGHPCSNLKPNKRMQLPASFWDFKQLRFTGVRSREGPSPIHNLLICKNSLIPAFMGYATP